MTGEILRVKNAAGKSWWMIRCGDNISNEFRTLRDANENADFYEAPKWKRKRRKAK